MYVHGSQKAMFTYLSFNGTGFEKKDWEKRI